MMPVLKTARLVLRPPRQEDAAPIALYLNDFAVAGNLARVPFPYRLGDAQAWLASRHPGLPPSEANFSILCEGLGFVGHIGFHAGPRGPVLGYWLGRPFWGRGIMTEAVGPSIAWFFTATGVGEIHSGVFHFNAASLAIQTRLGFVQTGRSSLLCLARGVEVEHIDTTLTLERFRQHQHDNPRKAISSPEG